MNPVPSSESQTTASSGDDTITMKLPVCGFGQFFTITVPAELEDAVRDVVARHGQYGPAYRRDVVSTCQRASRAARIQGNIEYSRSQYELLLQQYQ